jgi:small neutral amino acid transporter SnatA (MarC family)
VTRQNVTALSPWAVGDNTGPTAIALTTLAGRSSDSASLESWLVLTTALLVASVLIVIWRKLKVHV